MKKIDIIIFVVLLFVFGISCDRKTESSRHVHDSGKSQKELIVYGSEECSDCEEFVQKLDAAGIEYTFRDITANDQYYMELSRKIKAANYNQKVNLPVLDIEGKIFVNPPFSQIKNLLNY